MQRRITKAQLMGAWTLLVVLFFYIISALVQWGYSYIEGEEDVARRSFYESHEGEEVKEASRPVISGDLWPETSVLVWNVHNYRMMPLEGAGQLKKGAVLPKGEDSCRAVIDILAASHADILILVEVWGQRALTDISRRLVEKGIVYPYQEALDKQENASIVLLSKYPVKEKHLRRRLPFSPQLRHGEFASDHDAFMRRGILDVVIQVEDKGVLRILATHLKAKLGAGLGESVRRAEAQTLRDYLDNVLRKNPKQALMLCGDLNDTKDSPSMITIKGKDQSYGELTILSPKDKQGYTWTHYYKGGASYSQIDYMMVPSMVSWTKSKKKIFVSILEDESQWRASDHRPLLLRINNKNH